IQYKNDINILDSNIDSIITEMNEITTLINNKHNSIDKIKSDLNIKKEQINKLNDEINSPFINNLTKDEVKELNKLKKEEEDTMTKLSNIIKERNAIDNDKKKIESKL